MRSIRSMVMSISGRRKGDGVPSASNYTWGTSIQRRTGHTYITAYVFIYLPKADLLTSIF